MNEHDASLFAEDRGISDCERGTWNPPFVPEWQELHEIYTTSWFLALELNTIEREFPNG